MTVRKILSLKGANVTTVSPDITLADAVQLLAAKNIGAVVVATADREVRGILSERDIVRVLSARRAAALSVPIAEVMTSKVVTCGPDATISEIMGLMTGGHFRHVPVVEAGKLIGIVSIGDVVKARLDDVERESRALKDYILTA